MLLYVPSPTLILSEISLCLVSQVQTRNVNLQYSSPVWLYSSLQKRNTDSEKYSSEIDFMQNWQCENLRDRFCSVTILDSVRHVYQTLHCTTVNNGSQFVLFGRLQA